MPAQNSLTSFESVNQPTMSSREIAELVEARHNDVIATIERLFDKGLLRASRKSRRELTGGRPMDVYDLGERDTHLVVAGYSDEHRAKVIDRWEKLEQAAQPPRLPGRTTLKSIMGDFKVSTVEIAQALGIPHEVVLKGVRCHQFSGAISGEGAVEHRRTHPQNGLAYREFLLSPTEVLSLTAAVGPGARSKLVNLLLSLELDVDAAIQQADVQRLSYEPTPALPDARELEQAALRTLELSYEVCSRFHPKEKARAVAVKDTKRLHNLDLSHLLTQATPA